MKTLEDLLKQAKAGKQIADDDIPPALALKAPAAATAPSSLPPSLPIQTQPTRPAPSVPPAPAVRTTIPVQPSPGNVVPKSPLNPSGPPVGAAVKSTPVPTPPSRQTLNAEGVCGCCVWCCLLKSTNDEIDDSLLVDNLWLFY